MLPSASGTSSRMASMVKTCCPGRGRSRSSRAQAAPRGRSSVTAASALGARGSCRGTARTALSPRRPQMRSSEIMARIAKLEPKLLGMLQHVSPVLHVDLLLPATPSASSRSSTGAPRVSSSRRRLTSSSERFSASASAAALSRAARGAPGRGWSF